jgi:imidazolonepropionase
MLDAGAAIALASDYNPGSSPGSNMQTVVSMACIAMRMLPEEAINAATLNGAFAMQSAQNTGSISVGKFANLIITKPMPSLAYLPYAFSTPLIGRVIHKGTFI